MTDKAAQSKDQIDPRDVRFVVQADFHLASNNRPARDIYQMQNFVLDALDEGATEIRIRPYKQEGVEDVRDGCGSEQRERVATPPPSPTPVQGRGLTALLRDIKQTLCVPAAEYVPAMADAMLLLDKAIQQSYQTDPTWQSSSLPRGRE